MKKRQCSAIPGPRYTPPAPAPKAIAPIAAPNMVDSVDAVRHTESAMLRTRGTGPQATAYVSATISDADGFGFYVQMLGQRPDAAGLAQLTEQAMKFMDDALTRAQAAGLPLKGGTAL